MEAFFSSVWFTYGIIPLLIFLARIIDVSIGTIRVIFIARGYKFLAPLLGFFEVLVWLCAIQQFFEHLDSWIMYVAYAGGFATGTFVGIILEEKLSIGKVNMRIITGSDATKLFNALDKARFTFTVTKGKGPDGKVRIIHTIVDRHDTRKVKDLITKYNPHAFYSIEDVRYALDKEDHMNKAKFGFFRKAK